MNNEYPIQYGATRKRDAEYDLKKRVLPFLSW